MRISREVSGRAQTRDVPESQGRGEYEWCELTAEDPTDAQLLNRRIFLKLPDGRRIDTGCVFDYPDRQDKNRLRTAEDAPDREVYPIWHVAGLLLMPRPNRSQIRWGDGLPVLRQAQYGIAHLRMDRTTLAAEGEADLEVGTVDAVNHYTELTLNFSQRYGQVRELWMRRNAFDDDIATLLEEHERLAIAGQPTFAAEALRIVFALQNAAATTAADYGIPASPTTDVIPTLLELLNVPPVPQPPSLEAVAPEEAVIRLREAKEWRRWAAIRGASAIRFRRQVRRAYRFTCVVCGICLPPLGPGSIPGVDACHILPWADFDIDEIGNGLCLCKLHHWAFDEGLIEILHDGNNYHISIPEEARQRARDVIDLAFLDALCGPIPSRRLPRLVNQRPQPEYLRRLREELYG